MTDHIHLNPASVLPPVDTPLLIELEPGNLVRAMRPAFVEKRDYALEFRLDNGGTVFGRFRWTYP